jgi:hypothetical protein
VVRCVVAGADWCASPQPAISASTIRGRAARRTGEILPDLE